MKKLAVILILLAVISGLSIARPTPRGPGLDRPEHNCLHNGEVYEIIPVRAQGVCPAPPIYLNENGEHLPDPADLNKRHTPEDCLISIEPFTGPKPI